MEVFLAQIINGFSLGSIYVLLVTGFNLLLLAARIIHFTYPQVVVFSMYISWLTLKLNGNRLLPAAIAGVAAAMVVNTISAPLFRQVMKKRAKVDINATMVLSLALGMIITDLLSHGFNKGLPISFPRQVFESALGAPALLRIGLVSVTWGQFLSLALCLIAVIGLFWILYKTRAGRAFRAIGEDPVGAGIMGIPIFRTGIYSYALTGLLGGLTAVLLSLLLGSASPGLGEAVAHKVLAVSIIAGLGHLTGGLVVGLLLGVLEALTQGYLSGTWSNALAFLVMLVVILARPRGLFGSRL